MLVYLYMEQYFLYNARKSQATDERASGQQKKSAKKKSGEQIGRRQTSAAAGQQEATTTEAAAAKKKWCKACIYIMKDVAIYDCVCTLSLSHSVLAACVCVCVSGKGISSNGTSCAWLAFLLLLKNNTKKRTQWGKNEIIKY